MKKALSKSLKRFYGVGDFGFALMTNVETYFFSIFLTDIALFPIVLAGTIMTVTSVVDSVLSPIYGGIINATKPMKWGRYRSWLLICPPIVFLLYMFQYSKIGSDISAAVIICGGFILSHIIWNLAWVANVSLIPILSNTPDDRVLLSSHRGVYSNLARVVFSYVGAPLALIFAAMTGNTILGYTILAGLAAAVMWTGYWAHFKMTDGYENTEPQSAAKDKKDKAEKASLKELLSNLFKNPPLMVLIVADLSKNLTNFVIAAMAAYYFKYVAEDTNLLPIFLLISSVAAVVGSYLSKIIGEKLSARNGSILMFVVVAASLGVARIFAFNTIAYTASVSIALFGIGALQALAVALYADTVTYGEWKTGKNTAAFIMGLQNVPIKVGVIFRGVVVSAVLTAAGFVAGSAPTETLKIGIVNGMSVVPMISALIAAVLLLVGYRINKEKVQTMEAEITARKNNTN